MLIPKMEMKCKAGPLLYVCTTKSFLPHLQVFPFVFSEFLYVQRLIGVVRLRRNLFHFVLWCMFGGSYLLMTIVGSSL